MLQLLDEASRLLGSSLDYTATLRNLAQLLVPRLADICVVDMIEEGERVRRLEVRHADPEWDVRLRELASRHPPRLINPEHPLERAIASGAPQLVPVVDDDFLALIERDSERLQVLRELAPLSAMVVPLVTRGRTLGAITLVTTSRSGRRYDADDLSLASVLGRRAATAVDNASLYEAALMANKAKADFLAVVSHELRTPLTAIIGYEGFRLAMARLRASAEARFAKILQPALKAYVDANGGAFPTDVAQLQPFLSESVPPAVLQHYKVVPASEVKSVRVGGDWAITQVSVIDSEFDSHIVIGPRGFGSYGGPQK
jgi:signal transduction histidine kinase